MADIISLAGWQRPVYYTIHIAHHWDGTLSFKIEDVADDERTHEAIKWALGQMIEALGKEG